MALLPILSFPDPRLRTIAKPVEEVTDEIRQLAADMLETMYASNGVGLAAVQVGILKRVVVIDIGEGPMELVNPEITMEEGEQQESEGCLSLPGKYGITSRPKKVQVKAQDRNGKWQVFTGEDLKARAFCHEIDHLDGILFTSHLVTGKLEEE